MASIVTAWPTVALGTVLKRVERFESRDETQSYRFAGTYSFARGIFVSGEKSGLEFKLPKVQRIRAGDFVYCKIMAWEGAFGLVPTEADDCVMSGAFVVYEIDQELVDPKYLDFYFQVPTVWQTIGRQSTGTNVRRQSLDPAVFESATLPLPPLDEQRRIVARIEALASRIAEARRLRQEAIAEAEALITSEEMHVWPDKCILNAVPLESVTTFLARGRQSLQGDSDTYLIKTQHVQQGYLVAPMITLDSSVAAKTAPDAYVQRFDVLIACSAAGCLGRVAQFMEQVKQATTDTHVAIVRPNPSVVLPDYLYAYLQGAQGQVQLKSRERGDWQREKIGFRLTELNLADLKQVPVPLPPLSEQRRILQHLSTVYAYVDALKLHQANTSAELDALLPAVLNRAFRGEL